MGKQEFNNKTITVFINGKPGGSLITVPFTTARTERRKLERELKNNK